MNARRSTLIILFSIVSIHTIDASCPFYNVIFGNEDVSVSYKKQITNALRDFNVPQPEKVAVKKMNSVAARLLGNELYSFTLIGIWLNEPALNTLTAQEREFKLYHEAAHYAHKHHAQALGLVATALPLMTTFPFLFRSAYYHSAYKKLGNIFAYSASVLSWYGLYSYALKPFIKEQEQQADLAAARMLCAKGKKEIVEAYLNQLKNQLTDFSSDDWHYSQAEEYEYLSQLFATYIA